MASYYWSEVIKIIEGGMKHDTTKVVNYSMLLAEKVDADGEKKIADRIRQIAQINSSNTIQPANAALAMLSKTIPHDNESHLPMAEFILPIELNTEIVLNQQIEEVVAEFFTFYRNNDRLLSEGLPSANTILLYGPPGCGKTMLAQFIAKSLSLPLVLARLDSLISSFLGSTAKNIRQLFEYAQSTPCVLFLDEFDALAKVRDDKNEIGELKRVVNSLLQNIDLSVNAGSVFIAATNHEHLLDPAVWRRFDYRIHIDYPDDIARSRLIELFLRDRGESFKRKDLLVLTGLFKGCTGSEIKEICLTTLRTAVIEGRETLTLSDIGKVFFAHHGIQDEQWTDKRKARYLRQLDEKLFSYAVISRLLNVSKPTASSLLKEE